MQSAGEPFCQERDERRPHQRQVRRARAPATYDEDRVLDVGVLEVSPCVRRRATRQAVVARVLAAEERTDDFRSFPPAHCTLTAAGAAVASTAVDQ